MNSDTHSRARQLILESRTGDIAGSELSRIEDHIQSCAACNAWAGTIDGTIQSLRSVTVRLDSAMVEATRIRMQERIRELRSQRPTRAWLWAACILSWMWIVESGLLLWHGFAWVAARIGMPSPLWQMSFVMWWLAPVLVAAVALSFRSLQGADSISNG
jgi:anti-sigma factor RsiW